MIVNAQAQQARPMTRSRASAADFFAQQPTSTSALPSPRPLIENLARCVIEILNGARDLEQISRWVTDDVYRHLLKRTVVAARARQAKGGRLARPVFAIGTVITCEPVDGGGRVGRHRARARQVPRDSPPPRGAGRPVAGNLDPGAVKV